MGSSRRNQLAQVVMLKKMVKKCHGIAGAKICIRRRGYLSLDSDNGENIIPSDVPKGHIPVYVGAGRRRFVIPAKYLNDPLFRPFLEKAEEEFGFDHEMGLLIPCEEVTFQCLISLLDQRREAPRLLNSFF